MAALVESLKANEIEEISVSDAKDMFTSKVNDLLGIGPKAFVANYQAGEYKNSEDEAVLELIMMLPFIRS